VSSHPEAPQGITETEIANFLLHTPGFFERHAELLASVRFSHPLSQRAVSLQERQAELLRDKIKGLEHKIIEMIRHGQENESIADRLHSWTLSLMRCTEPAALPELLLNGLRQRFMIPSAGLRLWGLQEAHQSLPCAQEVSSDVKSFATSLSQPYCGLNAGFEASRWLGGDEIASVALIPLRREGHSGRAFGLLALGSPDPTRYTAEMGTDFLQRIGELASAALLRLLRDESAAR